MEQIKPIYPIVEEVSRQGLTGSFQTFVRIKRDHVWYLIFVTRNFESQDPERYFQDYILALNMFHREVYTVQVCTELPYEAVPWIVEDDNQEEESDRLLKLYPEGI